MFSHLNTVKFAHQMNSNELEDAPDRPPTLFIAIVVLLSFIFVFGIAALSYPMIEKFGGEHEDKVTTGMGNQARINYITSQQKVLSSFKKLDENYYQIPIDKSMEIVVKKQGNIFLSP